MRRWWSEMPRVASTRSTAGPAPPSGRSAKPMKVECSRWRCSRTEPRSQRPARMAESWSGVPPMVGSIHDYRRRKRLGGERGVVAGRPAPGRLLLPGGPRVRRRWNRDPAIPRSSQHRQRGRVVQRGGTGDGLLRPGDVLRRVHRDGSPEAGVERLPGVDGTEPGRRHCGVRQSGQLGALLASFHGAGLDDVGLSRQTVRPGLQ